METTWNSGATETGSGSGAGVEGFQVANMIYKIKKINKKKANAKAPRTKLAPPLETLDNQLDLGSGVGVESFSTLEPVVEGMGAGPGDYECGETVTDRTLDINSKGGPGDIIEAIYRAFLALNRRISTGVLEELTAKPIDKVGGANSRDVSIGADALGVLEALAFSCIVIYNWFYLMYYVNTDPDLQARQDKDGIPATYPYSFSLENLKIMADDNGLLDGFLYVFEFALFFPAMLDWFFLHIYPKYTQQYLNGTFCFVLLFIIIYNAAMKSGVSLKNLLIDVFAGATTRYTQFMYLIVVILFVKSVIDYGTEEEARITRGIITGKRTIISGMGLVFKNPIITFLRHLFRFIIIILISVPMGAIFSALYFLFYSLFGVLFYRGISISDYDIFHLFTKKSIFDKINQFVRDSSPGFKNDKNHCAPTTFFGQLMDGLRTILYFLMDMLFVKLFSIALLGAFSNMAYSFMANMSTVPTVLGVPLNMATMFLFPLAGILVIFAYTMYQLVAGDLKEEFMTAFGGLDDGQGGGGSGFPHDTGIDQHDHDLAAEIARIEAEAAKVAVKPTPVVPLTENPISTQPTNM